MEVLRCGGEGVGDDCDVAVMIAMGGDVIGGDGEL